MAENKENVNNTNTDNNSTRTEMAEEKTYQGYREEANGVAEDKVNSTIDQAIKETEEQIQARKLEKFKEAHPDVEINSIADLKGDLLSEYEAFQLEQADVQDIFTKAKDKIIEITKRRNQTLNELAGNKAKNTVGKVEELQSNIENKLNELAEEEKGLDPEKDKDRIEEISKERSTLEGLKEKIGVKGEKGQKGTLYGDLAIAFSNQNLVKENALNQLSNAFAKNVINGQEMVMSDKDLQNTLKRAERMTKDAETIGENLENTEKEEKIEEEQGKEEKQQVDPRMAAAAQQLAKNMGATPGNVVAGEAIDEKDLEAEPTGMDYLNQLGYDGQILKPDSSRKLLEAFVNAKEDVRLDILKDTDAQKKIFEAMKVANGRWTPNAALKFNKTRRALVAMANGPMMRKALEAIGENIDYTNMDQIEAKFTNAVSTYEANRTKKQEEISKMEDGEEKTKAQAELAEYDKQYAALKGVKDFRNISNKELTRRRDKIIDKMSGFFNRNEVATLKEPEKETEKTPEVNNKPENVKEGKDDFIGTLTGKTATITEKTSEELRNMTKNNLSPEEREKAHEYVKGR